MTYETSYNASDISFEAVYNEHHEQLINYCKKHSFMGNQAEDIVHDLFLKLYSNKIAVKSNIKGCLFWNLRSIIKTYQASHIARLNREDKYWKLILTLKKQSSNSECLSTILSMLDKQDRTLVELYYLERINQTEIAKTYGISQSAVNKRLKNIIKKLRSIVNIKTISSN